MFDKVKQIFGIGPKVDLLKLLQGGAVVVDVRSAAEYASGHIKGSLNVPHELIVNQMDKLSKDKPIITCCASGGRSALAKSLLLANGFTQVYNAGRWNNLLRYIV